MTVPQKLILASTSKFRKALMQNAGLEFQSARPEIDEREIGDPLEKSGADPIAIARTLAAAKAMDVSSRHPDTFVIGSDQTMALGKLMFHKPKDRDEAGRHIEILSGKTHSLHSAVAIVQNGNVLWEHVSSAHMTMRILSAAEIETYLEKAGERSFCDYPHHTPGAVDKPGVVEVKRKPGGAQGDKWQFIHKVVFALVHRISFFELGIV